MYSINAAEQLYKDVMSIILGSYPGGTIRALTESEEKYKVAVKELTGNGDVSDKKRDLDLAEQFFLYACFVIKGRFPEAEEIIATNPGYSAQYAQHRLGRRWTEAEVAILTNISAITHYTTYVIKGRWPEAENKIITNPEHAWLYTTSVIKGPWPEAEQYIATSPLYAYHYALKFKGPWPEAEDVISTSGEISMKYAMFVLNGRFIKGEPEIAKTVHWSDYCKKFGIV